MHHGMGDRGLKEDIIVDAGVSTDAVEVGRRPILPSFEPGRPRR